MKLKCKTIFDAINVVAKSRKERDKLRFASVKKVPVPFLMGFLKTRTVPVFLLFLILSNPVVLNAGNLLTNGTFETTGSPPAPWAEGGGVRQNGTTQSTVYANSYSLYIATANINATQQRWVYQNVSVTAGQMYNQAGYVYKDSANSPWVGLSLLSGGGGWSQTAAASYTDATSTRTANTGSWKFLVRSTVPAAGVSTMGINVGMRVTVGLGATSYFDNIYFGQPDAPTGLTQLAGSGRSAITSMQWTTESIIISSFTQSGSANNSVKFCLQVTSVTTVGDAADWTTAAQPLFVNYKSTPLAEGATCYNWPTLTDTATYWWQMWSEDNYGGVVGSTTTTLGNGTTAKFGFTSAANQSPYDVSGLTQLAGGTTILPSMAWTASSVIISSFTLKDPDAGNTVKFYLHITSVTTAGDGADWSQLWHASTSAYLSQGTTQYNWPALTQTATYWWRVWCEDNSGASSVSTTTFLADDSSKKAALLFDGSTPDIVAVDAGPSLADRTSFTSGTAFNYVATGSDDQISFSWTDPNSPSGDTFYYEYNNTAGNTINGAEATNTANPYIDGITVDETNEYFHVASSNSAGTLGTERTFNVFYDKTNPTVSIGSISESSNYLYANGSIIYTNNAVAVPGSFIVNVTAADTGGSGVANTSGETAFGDTPSDNSDPYQLTYSVEQSATSDGTITITATDNANNTNTANVTHYNDLTVPPDVAALNSATHTPNVWNRNNNVTVTWTDVTDLAAGTSGYYIKCDHTSNTTPTTSDDGIAQGTQSKTYSGLADGSDWYFHIIAVDNVGNLSATATHFGPIKIDATAPSAPAGLKQINGYGTELNSMQWSSSTVVISSFTLADNISDTKFYLWVSSQTSGTWTPLVFAATSQLLTPSTTGYKWPALTDYATYWWWVWAEDSAGNTSSTSTALAIDGNPAKLGVDVYPPAAITDLGAVLNSFMTGEMKIFWTAPRNSDGGGDKVTSYDLRYATWSFTGGNWNHSSVTQYAGEPTPSVPGTLETVYLNGGLNLGTTYYFHIKSSDTFDPSAIDNGTVAQVLEQHIVISEVMIATTSTSGEYVELYNPTTVQFDLSSLGLKLHIINGAGTDGNAAISYTPPANTTIPAKGYFLIAGTSTASGIWPSNVTPDATYATSSNNLVNGGDVYISTYTTLYSTGAVDLLGLDNVGGNWEGTAFGSNPADGQSAERKANSSSTAGSMAIGGADEFNGNGYDTNNNSNDFVSRTTGAQPQNTSSDTEPSSDTTPPAAISDLTALAGSGNNLRQVKLSWTSPGDDGVTNNLTGTFRINYSSVGIVTASNFINTSSTFATVVNISTTTLTPLTACTTTLFNLNTGTTYWFAIKTADDVSNWSVWNSTADNAAVNTLAYCFMNSSPSAPSELKQITTLVGATELPSMQWTNSSTVISSFTLSDTQTGDTVKFYLHITSVTSGTSADWAQHWHASTSTLMMQQTTSYQWPALSDNGTYWWRVWCEDSSGATSSTSTTLGVDSKTAKLGFDNIAPDAVTNLTALAGWKTDTVVLKWTSPAGSPATYLMRYSTASFSNSEWDAAWVKNLNIKATIPTPATSGVTELMLITGLTNGTSYWFGIKSQDALGNTSAINSNTQDFAVAQTSNPIIINEIAPWQTSDFDMVELYIKNACYVSGLKFYAKENTTPSFIELKTFPTTSDWEKELPAGTYIMLYCERADTDETTVGQSLANTIKIFTTAGGGLRGVATDGRTGYCVLSDTTGVTISANIITAGEVLDFVGYASQNTTGFGSTFDDDNIAYAISKGQWISTTSVSAPVTFDCATSKSIATNRSLARNNIFDKIYNSKYDWSYRTTFSTASANGTDEPTSGVGTCTVSPGTAGVSTAGTWKFKYTNASTASGARHTVVLNIPYGWTQPQTTDGTLAGFTTAYYTAAGEPPQNATFDSGYGAVASQIIGTNAGWRVVATIGTMAGSAELYIVYGATYSSTSGQATAPAASGTYTFRVYSDTNGVNVSEIASSPQITVNESVPPAAISDLTALEGTDDGIVKLNWTSPGDNGITGNLTGTFRIKYSSVAIVSSGNFDSPPSNLAVITVNISTSNLTPLTACTTTMYGLNPGTSYFFAIKTADDVDNWSVWNSSANDLSVNTSAYCAAHDSVPPAPSNLVATAGNQQITLTWDAVSGEPDLNFYRIYCDSNPPVAEEWYIVGTTPAVNTSYLHTGLTNNSTYNYKITVVDLGNSTSGYSTANESAYSNTYSTYPTTYFPDAALLYYSSQVLPLNLNMIPQFRRWKNNAFDPEEATTNMDGIVDRFTVARMCPTSVRKEIIVGASDNGDGLLDTTPDINVSIYTIAAGWSAAKEIANNCGVTAARCFDIAYEQSSGDALVVARTPTSTSVPYYWRYNGSTWVDNGVACPALGSGALQWIRLEPKPNSNEIILVTCDANNDVYASVWNGDTNSFGNTQLLEIGSVSASQGFDVAYTQSAGVGFVVWVAADSTRPKYRTWDGYSWSAETTTVHDHYALAAGRNIKLAANPKNNELLLGTNDSGDDINVEVWSSTLSVWLGGKEIDATARALTIRTFDVVYEKSSGDGLLVYADSAGGAPVGWTWNAGGSGIWASGANANNTGAATLNWVQLASDDLSDKIHLITSDADGDINVQTWSGTAWGSITEVETESSNSNESFFCRFPKPVPSDTVAPAAVTSLSGLSVSASTGTLKLTWSAPGDDVWIGRLTNGCQYEIRYCTSTANRVWTTMAAVSSPTASNTIPPGLFLSTTIQNLVGDLTYYCLIRYYDGTNWAALSNEATAYAQPMILSVDIVTDPASYNFLEVALGASTQTITVIQVKNDGNIIENFALRCGTNTAGSPWFSIETSSGADNYLLRAVFHPSQPAFSAFADPPGDIVSDDSYQVSQTVAGGGRYTVNDSETGVNVGVNATKNLWLRLDMPLTSQTVATQEIILYIRAESP
ncbi:MAG: hypothetical protein WC947_05710 [Elusimicrobiota bacterium]